MNPRTEWLLKNEERVKSMALRYGIPPEEIDDFFQEALLQSCSIKCNCRENRKVLHSYSKMFVLWCVTRYRRMLFKTKFTTREKPQPENAVEKLEEIMLEANETEKKILKMKLDGSTFQNIAQKMGVSPSYISKVLKALRKKIFKKN